MATTCFHRSSTNTYVKDIANQVVHVYVTFIIVEFVQSKNDVMKFHDDSLSSIIESSNFEKIVVRMKPPALGSSNHFHVSKI